MAPVGERREIKLRRALVGKRAVGAGEQQIGELGCTEARGPGRGDKPDRGQCLRAAGVAPEN